MAPKSKAGGKKPKVAAAKKEEFANKQLVSPEASAPVLEISEKPEIAADPGISAKPRDSVNETLSSALVTASSPTQKLSQPLALVPDPNDHISLVAVGATGQGKSTLGNTLATRDAFEVSGSFDSQTRHSSHVDYDIDGIGYRFVDTVGFFDTKLTPERVHEKFADFADRAPSGVTAFLYIERKGRFSDEQLKHFNIFKGYVGEEALRHTIMVFTHISNEKLQLQMQQDEEEVRTPPQLREVLRQVFTAVGVESVDNPTEARQVILDAVRKIAQQNGGETYANKALHDASLRRKELQAMVEGLPAGDRKSSMEYALMGLYDGSRAYHEVRGTIMHAQVTEEKEKIERQLQDMEREKAAVEAEKLKADYEGNRVKEELEQTRREHERQAQEWQRLDDERRKEAEEERKRCEERHLREMEDRRKEAEEERRRSEERHSREVDERRKEAEEERQRCEERHQRDTDERRKQAEEERRMVEEKHSVQIAALQKKAREVEEATRNRTERHLLELKELEREKERCEEQHAREAADLKEQLSRQICEAEEEQHRCKQRHECEVAELNAEIQEQRLVGERQAQRNIDLGQEHERQMKEQARIEEEGLEACRRREEEHQLELQRHAEEHVAEHMKVQMEMQQGREEFDAQCKKLKKLREEFEGQCKTLRQSEADKQQAQQDLALERKKLQTSREEEEKRIRKDEEQKTRYHTEVEQLQTLFASQQSTIAQHRDRVEASEARGKLMGAALIACSSMLVLRLLSR